MKHTLLLIALLSTFFGICQAQNYYNTTAGNGYGFRFWNGSDSYKIHMGNSSEYKYGPVTDYSIKMNMNSTLGRGWTWGIQGLIPIAALNNEGDFQVGGYIQSQDYITVNKGSAYRVAMNGQAHGYITGRNDNVENKFLIHSNGNSYFNGGNVGVGTTGPKTSVHIFNGSSGRDPHGFTDLTVEDDDNVLLSLLTQNDKNAYYGFADTDDDFVGGIQYYHPNDMMFFRVNNHAADMVINKDGKVGIGTTLPDVKLTVKGNIHAEEVKVDLSVPGPDYVFKEDYDLKSLEEVQNHIKEHGHLPNIPSAQEMERDGIQLGEMNMKLLEKIEELTLYIIGLKKENEDYLHELEKIKEELNQLKSLKNE